MKCNCIRKLNQRSTTSSIRSIFCRPAEELARTSILWHSIGSRGSANSSFRCKISICCLPIEPVRFIDSLKEVATWRSHHRPWEPWTEVATWRSRHRPWEPTVSEVSTSMIPHRPSLPLQISQTCKARLLMLSLGTREVQAAVNLDPLAGTVLDRRESKASQSWLVKYVKMERRALARY